MKKNILIVILIACIIVSFFLGRNFDRTMNPTNAQTQELVGIYETDSWNGKPAILALYDDGTCQYPSGSGASWRLEEGNIVIAVKSLEYDNGDRTINVHFANTKSEDEIKAIARSISNLSNVESVKSLIDEYQKRIYVKLINPDTTNEIYNAISSMDGISSLEYEYREIESQRDHEAKIMENGLMLHGKFFKKISN